MQDPTPKFTIIPETPKDVGDNDIYMGLRSRYYIDAMKNVPGLYEKLSNIKQGEVPSLSESEKEFFVDMVMRDAEGISSLIVDVAEKIWGASTVEWKQDSKYRRENTAAALWWHFCSSNRERDRVSRLIDFYFGTIKEQAEKEITTWKEWEGRTNVKLLK